eukprot:m.37075 g.37075  ORF g.37075 m.37075 type:complete len:1054 (+) comp10065_c0_seq3:230-3391(+)
MDCAQDECEAEGDGCAVVLECINRYKCSLAESEEEDAGLEKQQAWCTLFSDLCCGVVKAVAQSTSPDSAVEANWAALQSLLVPARVKGDATLTLISLHSASFIRHKCQADLDFQDRVAVLWLPTQQDHTYHSMQQFCHLTCLPPATQRFLEVYRDRVSGSYGLEPPLSGFRFPAGTTVVERTLRYVERLAPTWFPCAAHHVTATINNATLCPYSTMVATSIAQEPKILSNAVAYAPSSSQSGASKDRVRVLVGPLGLEDPTVVAISLTDLVCSSILAQKQTSMPVQPQSRYHPSPAVPPAPPHVCSACIGTVNKEAGLRVIASRLAPILELAILAAITTTSNTLQQDVPKPFHAKSAGGFVNQRHALAHDDGTSTNDVNAGYMLPPHAPAFPVTARERSDAHCGGNYGKMQTEMSNVTLGVTAKGQVLACHNAFQTPPESPNAHLQDPESFKPPRVRHLSSSPSDPLLASPTQSERVDVDDDSDSSESSDRSESESSDGSNSGDEAESENDSDSDFQSAKKPCEARLALRRRTQHASSQGMRRSKPSSQLMPIGHGYAHAIDVPAQRTQQEGQDLVLCDQKPHVNGDGGGAPIDGVGGSTKQQFEPMYLCVERAPFQLQDTLGNYQQLDSHQKLIFKHLSLPFYIFEKENQWVLGMPDFEKNPDGPAVPPTEANRIIASCSSSDIPVEVASTADSTYQQSGQSDQRVQEKSPSSTALDRLKLALAYPWPLSYDPDLVDDYMDVTISFGKRVEDSSKLPFMVTMEDDDFTPGHDASEKGEGDVAGSYGKGGKEEEECDGDGECLLTFEEMLVLDGMHPDRARPSIGIDRRRTRCKPTARKLVRGQINPTSRLAHGWPVADSDYLSQYAWVTEETYPHAHAAIDIDEMHRALTSSIQAECVERNELVEIRKIVDEKHPCYGSHGLFARQDIPRLTQGEPTRIGVYTGVLIPILNAQNDLVNKSSYVAQLIKDKIDVDAGKWGNEMRYINHWKGIGTVNVQLHNEVCDCGTHLVRVRAVTNIRKGQELLLDYGKEYWENLMKHSEESGSDPEYKPS